MIKLPSHHPTHRHITTTQQGMALITSLLLLLVVTILAVSMFRNFSVQEKIAGNLREKQRALHAAVSAQKYAEWWLSTRSNISTGTICNGVLSTTAAQVCSNALTNAATLPWNYNSANVGVSYAPPNMVQSTSGGAGNNSSGTYYSLPLFYIYYLGSAPGGQGAVYQVDAVGYGGGSSNTAAAAVVESTFQVSNGVKNLGGL